MESNPQSFVTSTEEGIRRVLNNNYAFFMESANIDYNVQNDCNLTQIGGLLDHKGYGIAAQRGIIIFLSLNAVRKT
jgi:ionotropic glutamate receptor